VLVTVIRLKRSISEHTGEIRAIELQELPNEIPIAKRSASAAPLAASPMSNEIGNMYVFELKKIGISRHGVKVDLGEGNPMYGWKFSKFSIEGIEKILSLPQMWLVLIDSSVALARSIIYYKRFYTGLLRNTYISFTP
jgi:hypothetical protein